MFRVLKLFTFLYNTLIFGCPAGNCMLKVNNRNSKTICEIYSKLTIKTLERRQFERISHLVLVFLLLTLGR